MKPGSIIKNTITRVKKAVVRELMSKKNLQDERYKKLDLLFKACALVVFADGKVTVEEFMGLEAIFQEMEVPEEDRHYFSQFIDRGVSMEDIKKELQKNNYSREDLEEIIKLCISIAKVDSLCNEEKLVIARLRNIFGLKK